MIVLPARGTTRRTTGSVAIVLAAWALGASGDSRAAPRVCVLDGGGTVEERSCGVGQAMERIRSVYSGSRAQASIDVLSGPETSDGEVCRTDLLGCADGSCGGAGAIGADSWNHQAGAYERIAPTVGRPSDLGKARRGERFHGGTEDDFRSACFFDSASPPERPIDNCHFWSLNHGTPRGALFFDSDPADKASPVMSTELLRRKADRCSNFRFVTHSCYGGQLGDLIYDENNRVIEGRCGMSAAPPGFTAQGLMSTSPDDPEIVLNVDRGSGGRASERQVRVSGRPGRVSYPMVENMALAAGTDGPGAGSLDAFQASLMTQTHFSSPGSTGEPQALSGISPYLTSDYFLSKELGSELKPGEEGGADFMLTPSERERARLVDRVVRPHHRMLTGIQNCLIEGQSVNDVAESAWLGLEPAILAVDPARDEGLSPDEKALMEQDLRDEVKRFAVFNKLACMDVPDPDSAVGANSHVKLGACDLESRYLRFLKERDRRMTEYEALRKEADEALARLHQACRAAGPSASSYGAAKVPCGDLRGIEAEIRRRFKGQMLCSGQRALMIHPDRPIDAESIRSCAPEVYELTRKRDRILELRSGHRKAQESAGARAAELEAYLGRMEIYRRYERQKARFARVVEMYRNGSVSQVRDYLKIRQCERTPMSEPVSRFASRADG